MAMLAECAQPAPSLASLPDDILEEIAIRSHPLIALRTVIRFRLRAVAATRIARWFRAVRPHLEPPRPVVGDRVICRWPAHLKHPPCYATVAARVGYHHGRLLWRVWLFDGTYVKMQTSRMRRLEPWKDGVWGESIGRTSALAAASVAREAATRATSTAMAAMASTSSSAETALAVAVASAACTAAAAATSAATAAGSSGPALALGSSGSAGAAGASANGAGGAVAHGTRGGDGSRELTAQSPTSHVRRPLTPRFAADPEWHQAQATSLLGVARGMREAVEAQGTSHPSLTNPQGGTDLTRLHEAALDAADAAAEAAAATHAAGAIGSLEGTLPITAGTAAAAATAAANVVAAIEELAGARRNNLGQPGAAASSAASSAAAGAILEMGAAGRALNRSWGTQPQRAMGSGSGAGPSAPIEHTSSSAVVEQAAAMVRSASHAMLAQHCAAGGGVPGGPSEAAASDMAKAFVADEEAAMAAAMAASLSDSDSDDDDDLPSRCALQ